MKAIKGQFVMRYDGKPASFGTLTLKLVSEEQALAEIVPVGEAAERFLIPIPETEREEWRSRQESWKTAQQIAEEEAEVFKVEYDIPEPPEILLDIEGRIPPGTEVVGNDEITGNTFYLAVVTVPQDACRGFNNECFKEEVRITGDAPVDLHEAVIREPEPEIIPPTSRERELRAEEAIVRDGTLRLGKRSHLGFAIGPIHLPPALMEPTAVPYLAQEKFGVCGFTRSSPALINHVTVYVEETPNRDHLLIAMYNTNGSKVVETEIDLTNAGAATGFFASEVHLPEGDYFMAWATRTVWAGKLRGWPAQFDLMNAAGAPVIGLGQATDREALPPTLGRVFSGLGERRMNPIFAYFKA